MSSSFLFKQKRLMAGMVDINFVFKSWGKKTIILLQTGGFEESGEDDDDDSDGDWTSEDDSDEEYDEKAENVDSVTTRFDRATNLTSGVNPTSGEEVGDLKARIEEMKRSMAMDAMKRMKDGDEAGSDFDDADFDDLEETKSR